MTSVVNTINSTKMHNESEYSDIQSFYTDATVFLTGATGFMGNLILEKLIRTCSGVKKIYILIREKKGKTIEERFKALFNDPVFSVMKKEQPEYLNKISAIIGDCELPNLGVAEQYQEILKNEVNIVIHSAATVRFDEHLKIAVNINILALQDLLKLGQNIKHLKAFVHISTAYSNCAGRKVVKEVFYKPPITGDSLAKVCQSLDDNHITELTPSLLREWPNTYAMTKAIAESEILTYGKGLPVGIIRPSMIVSTDKEPLPGWINNHYGPTGIVVATGIGILRVMRAEPKGVADIIPGDIVTNAILASAWDIHNRWKLSKNVNMEVKPENVQISEPYTPPIFNIVSSSSNPVTWGEFSSINQKYGKQMPSTKSIWPIIMRVTSNKYEYIILCFLLHTIPGLLIDMISVLARRKPKLSKSYKKIHKFIGVLTYFSMQSWTFHDDNTRSLLSKMSNHDRHLFNFDISKLSWNDYFKRYVEGFRTYILKDTDDDSFEKGKKHLRRLYMFHYTLLAILTASVLLILYGLFTIFI